jgi:hypothetical protein
MIKDLIKIANRLDSLGLTKEADFLDSIIKKVALTEEDFSRGKMKLTVSIEATRHPDAFSLYGSHERQLRAKLDELLINGPSRAEHMGTYGMEGQIESGKLLTFNSPSGPLRENARPGSNPESFSVKFDPINSENRSYQAGIRYVFDIPFGYSDEVKEEGIRWIVESAKMGVELALSEVTAERGTNWNDYFVVTSRLSF